MLALDGAAVLHRGDGGWRVEAASGDRASREPRGGGTTIELDPDHVLALAGGAVRSEDQRVLDAFAKELAASVELGELEAEAEAAAPRPPRASSAPRSSRPSPTTSARPLAAIKASVTSLLQEDVDWTPEARRGVPRNDRRGDRPPRTRSSATCST